MALAPKLYISTSGLTGQPLQQIASTFGPNRSTRRGTSPDHMDINYDLLDVKEDKRLKFRTVLLWQPKTITRKLRGPEYK